jgi:CheY-like chemotaxis protein
MPDQTFVLVAEDEELVRLVIVQALRDEGFEVMEVEHAEALRIIPRSTGHGSGCLLPRLGPAPIAQHFPRKAGFWRSHTNTAMSFAIFAS